MAELIFSFDPLCGWCYGLMPAVAFVQSRRPDLAVAIALAGRFAGVGAQPYAELSDRLTCYAQRIHTASGQSFGPAFFELARRPDVMADSGPPDRVISAVRGIAPARALMAAHAIQQVHFRDGRDLNDPASYGPALEACGLDPALGKAAAAEDAATGDRLAAEYARTAARSQGRLPALHVAPGDGTETAVTAPYEPLALLARLERLIAPRRAEA